MEIDSCTFLKSSTHIKDYPSANLPEYAIIGRSNVGKSSLINMLAGRKKLAHTSSTPGRTRTLNFFLINENWLLVDLPGYGYAKTSKKNRKAWFNFTEQYLLNRENLMCVIALIDIRIPPQPIDMEFLNWLGKSEIPFVIGLTKSDKLNKEELEINITALVAELEKDWSEIPEYFITSAKNKIGKEELLSFIHETNQLFSTAS